MEILNAELYEAVPTSLDFINQKSISFMTPSLFPHFSFELEHQGLDML